MGDMMSEGTWTFIIIVVMIGFAGYTIYKNMRR